MEGDRQLTDTWQQVFKKRFASVSTAGGRNNQSLWFKLDGRRIQGRCFGDVSAGECLAAQLDNGEWVLINAQVADVQASSRNLELRRTKNKEKTKSKGFLQWLDCNWMIYGSSLNREFFRAIIKYFLGNSKKIYTLTPDSRAYVELSFVWGLLPYESYSPFPYATQVLEEEGINIIGTNLTANINGIFFLPLMTQTSSLTEQEAIALKKLAKNKGVIICGEWNTWVDYNNRILDILVGDRIRHLGDVPFDDSQKSDGFYAKKMRLPDGTLDNDASGIYAGATQKEILMKSVEDGEPTMILVQPNDIRGS